MIRHDDSAGAEAEFRHRDSAEAEVAFFGVPINRSSGRATHFGAHGLVSRSGGFPERMETPVIAQKLFRFPENAVHLIAREAINRGALLIKRLPNASLSRTPVTVSRLRPYFVPSRTTLQPRVLCLRTVWSFDADTWERYASALLAQTLGNLSAEPVTGAGSRFRATNCAKSRFAIFVGRPALANQIDHSGANLLRIALAAGRLTCFGTETFACEQTFLGALALAFQSLDADPGQFRIVSGLTRLDSEAHIQYFPDRKCARWTAPSHTPIAEVLSRFINEPCDPCDFDKMEAALVACSIERRWPCVSLARNVQRRAASAVEGLWTPGRRLNGVLLAKLVGYPAILELLAGRVRAGTLNLFTDVLPNLAALVARDDLHVSLSQAAAIGKALTPLDRPQQFEWETLLTDRHIQKKALQHILSSTSSHTDIDLSIGATGPTPPRQGMKAWLYAQPNQQLRL